MWGMLYVIVLVLAALFSLPFFNVINDTIGNSLETQKLLDGFDHTVYRDFINSAEDRIQIIFSQVRLFMPFFIIFFVFLTGGIIKSFDDIEEPWNSKTFWSNCSQYFWRILRVFLFFFGIQLVLATLIYLPFLKWMFSNINNVANEITFVRIGAILVVLHLFLATFIATVSDYTKVRLIKEDRSAVLKESLASFHWVRHYFRNTYPIYLLNILTVVVLVLTYWFFESKIGMVSTFTIFVLFLIQQLFLFLRLGVKLMDLAAATAMYTDIQNKSKKSAEPLVIDGLTATPKSNPPVEKVEPTTPPLALDLTADDRVEEERGDDDTEALKIEL